MSSPLPSFSPVVVFIVGRDGFTFPQGYIGPDSYDHYASDLLTDYSGGPSKDWCPDGLSSTWVSEGFGRAVKRFVEQGGGLFAWHNNLHVSAFSESYRAVTGDLYDGHPPLRPWQVKVVNANHPVTQGVSDFIVTDEQHFPICDRPVGYLLLRGVNIDRLTFDSDSGAVRGGAISVTPGRTVSEQAV